MRPDTLTVAAECDLDCLLCDRQEQREAPDALAELERLNAPRRLRIAGCDPLRRPDLARLIARAKEIGSERVTVVTNGVRLATPGAAEALAAAGADEVELTLYTTVPSEHDAITRRRGSHARLLEAMARIAETPLEVRLRIPLLSRQMQDLAALVGDGLSRCPRAVGWS